MNEIYFKMNEIYSKMIEIYSYKLFTLNESEYSSRKKIR